MKSVRTLFVVGLVAVVSASYALPMLQVTIQPIIAANTNGTMQSQMTAYQNYATKIYAQADIQLNILAPNYLNNTSYNSFNYNNANTLVQAAGAGQNANPLVINAWFVKDVINASVYGFAYLNAPYMVMDTTAILGYSALGRVDTFSHELGHVLGLPHVSGNNRLMAAGGGRNIPQTLGNVAPDGLGYDLLVTSEINTIRNSRFALPVPEPTSLAALAFGVAVLCRKRRKSA
ncbi:MAG: PEP-CTERM sorting domain-containing protein [Armatimonadetes bacterium]|nr:PEP-CTERM sorting domain-containing protein [Armatimonadota bacterium]